MALCGIHVPNIGGGTGPIAGVSYDTCMDAMLSIGYESFVGLHMDLDFLFRASLSYPDSLRQIVWGYEGPNDSDACPFDQDPTALANFIYNWYITVKTAPAGVTPIERVTHHCTGNEPNLEGRFAGDNPDWAGINSWLTTHYSRLRTLLGNRLTLHMPALGVVGSEVDALHNFFGSTLALCDVLDIHAYGKAKWNWMLIEGGGWVRNTTWSQANPEGYVPNWWKNPNLGATFTQYRYILDKMGFPNMPINITEFNRVWYDEAWYNSLPDANKAELGQYHYPEAMQDAIDYAAQVIEYRRFLDRSRRAYKLLSACGFIWASNDVRFRSMSWMRGNVVESVAVAERGYIPSSRPIDGGGGLGLPMLALGGLAAVGMIVAQSKGLFGRR